MTGTLLLGRYRLKEQIGSGGMANVYLARDEQEKTDVAVKVLKEEHTQNEALLERFESEAQTGRMLCHENIVRVFDTGEEDGKHFIVMELARGITLKEVIKEHIQLDTDACINIAVQVLRALSYAHEKGVVHRDIKPHNILLQANGCVKVYDFGIAQTIGERGCDEESTNVMGTVYYLSPEQARAEAAEVRSDIYSLGITLFEMLTGTLPFEGTSVIEVAKRHLYEEVPAPLSVNPEIPRSLNDIVRRATRKNPKLRYRNAQEMMKDLLRAQQEPDGDFVVVKEEALPFVRTETEEPQPDRVKRRIYCIVGLVLVFVLGTIAVLLFGSTLFSPHEAGEKVVAVIGLKQSAAEEKLKSMGFTADVIIEPDSDEPEGTVLRQEPAEGETLAEGGTVRIYVSGGVATVTMPNVLDMKLSDAKNIIAQNNLMLGDVIPVTSDAPSGYVIGQNPKPGEDILPNTQVDIWVSIGSEQTPAGTVQTPAEEP
ncbi:MAG: protein kinase domain-containing protein [Bacillota bacterium]